mgnify:FL=1
MKRFLIVIFGCLFLSVSVTSQAQNKPSDKTLNKNISARFSYLLDFPVDSVAIPRSVNLSTGIFKKVKSEDWTSGFFPGTLWQIYKLTGDVKYKEKAAVWNAFIEKEKHNGTTHDMGFKVYSSFGKGLTVVNNDKYKKIIVKSAQTLITRFNSKIGAIRSWDHSRELFDYPVIIDNMLNLELLFEASKISPSIRKFELSFFN